MLDKTNAATPANFAVLFPTPDAMFEAMFGPEQHDFHVREFKLNASLTAQRVSNKSANDMFAAKFKEYGSYTAWLRAEPTKMGNSK